MNTVQIPEKTMSSKELYEIICVARYESGEVEPRINDFHNRVVDELEGEHYESFVVQNPNKTESTYFNLTVEQCTLVGMRESKAVRRSVLKKLKGLESQLQPTLPANYIEALEALVISEKEKAEAKEQLQVAAPKVEFYDQVTGSSDTVDMAKVAKVLNVKGIGRNKLFQILRDKSVLQKDNSPYQNYIDRGYFRVIESKYNKPDGSVHISLKTVVYQKGLDYIRKILTKEAG